MARSTECKCESNFTCGYCMRNAPPWIFTPYTGPFKFSYYNQLRLEQEKK